MVHHRLSVLHELLLRHVPRGDILSRSLMYLRIQMHCPRRTHDLVSPGEGVPAQLGRLHDGPDRHHGGSETKGFLNRRVHQWKIGLIDEVDDVLVRV